MSEFVRTPRMMKREVSADGGTLWRTLYQLWPYMWPADRPDLKARVVIALGLLLLAQARHHRGAVHLQMGDRRAGRRTPVGANGDSPWRSRCRC